MAGTHPENMELFVGFTIGKLGKEKILYGKGSGNSSTDQH
ncbi:hypothetical protein LCGC14_0388750 [marine sediment metagenome]|uniref:Uncharacterized protein n=1 Tax=marine sediment metagenome TaxID=412755 RepID=A0A0F9W9B1_9ZZZZ